MKEKVKILGVEFDNITMDEAVKRAIKFTEEKSNATKLIVTANPIIVMLAQDDKEYMDIISKADMVTADGIGIVKVSKKYGTPLPERVTGYELMCNLFKEGYEKGKTFYLLGGKEGVVDKATENIEKQYPNIKIVGKHHGYFRGKEDEIITEISKCKPDFLFVCLGAPAQEKFIYKNRDKLNAKLAIGLGGSFDAVAGTVKKSPKIYEKMHIEWLYRAVREPKRFKKLLIIPSFLKKVRKETKSKKI